ncbi:hypothetical protein EST38_g2212 [Candolleomyces aberdarensis]|uniref:Probable alpha/beta-glucosidase agdC n=1 Tax=Candolleomyces aberdarensis TaxID=2316362 RepID=A0A4Q2DT24_9AGAR|nr:hypothetical protein EST38_g2212 [Candolleomyces aberdarensis]
MWWRGTTLVLSSSTLLSTLLSAVVHAPGSYAAYVDPAVLDACPGYVTRKVSQTRGGSEIRIELGLPANSTGCAVFGQDIQNLVLVATYETSTRLHVKVTDANNRRYEVPEDVFPRPKSSFVPPRNSQLKFNYTTAPQPFALTISRASTNEVLFTTAGFPLIYEDRYLRIKTSLPAGANIYGLGEHSHTFRLDANNGGQGLTRTLWSRDSFGIPLNSNLYGNHPVYYDHRTTGTHGVLLLNSNGMDIKLNETTNGNTLEYNVIGGVLDFYFLAGSENDPVEVAKQYAELSGYAAEVPYWSLGFHQYFIDVAGVISNYLKAEIPLETMWTDIDYMRDRLIFTVDPQYFPMSRMREIVSYLHSHNQHYIVMTDPAVGFNPNSPTPYESFNRGESLGIWLKNNNGSNHLGVVWPGVTVYPDWFHPRITDWWNDEFARFYSPQEGLDIDGVWIDMNEPASFCDYPCTDPFGQAVLQNMPPKRGTSPPDPNAPIFTDAGASVDVAPRAYESSQYDYLLRRRALEKRQDGPADDPLLNPPYAIDNTVGALSSRTAYTNVRHFNNLTEYDTHNLYGTMMSTATRHAMLARRPSRRPFVITRSTFAGAGKHVGKWLGDNLSTWEHYRASIAGMLNFASVFNVPMVGSDVCGFGDNTTETLCARWATLGAFNPFFRNHNIDTGNSQEFFIWPLTTAAAKNGIDIRYRLLDYIYTAFHAAHVDGTPLLSPLWYKYPKDTTTYPIDLQFFYGPSVLVSPVTDEGSTSVRYYLPQDTFYDFATLSTVSGGQWITQNDVAYDQIPLHIKGGSVVPLRNQSAMTLAELRTKSFNLVVAPDSQGRAQGDLYLDDGERIDPPPSRTTQISMVAREHRSEPGSGSLLGLPNELQFHICSETTVEDLMALGKTCKALHQVVSDRRLWEVAVLSMCRHHGLFEPSYPVESMGVVDLQKAAFGPILFNRRMKKFQANISGKMPTLRPGENKFVNKLTSTISELIPGGRYLLTGGSFTGSIVLWDLGTAGPFYRVKPKQELLGIAQCALDHSRFVMKALTPITPRPGETTLRFTATYVVRY